jgi:hypothetical protein
MLLNRFGESDESRREPKNYVLTTDVNLISGQVWPLFDSEAVAKAKALHQK